MNSVVSIGTPPWTREEMVEHLDEFINLYSQRPVKSNEGGMKTPHMFATWFMVKKLNPDLIVESGVWKGQGTWLLEQACPDARIVSIDLNLGYREYISEKVEYSDNDFSEQDWTGVTDRSLAFIDDHQNAYKRLQQCKWFGFKNIIFEDNYPASQGDCYSLKKAFANAGFEPYPNAPKKSKAPSFTSRAIKKSARVLGLNTVQLTPQYEAVNITPNEVDSKMLYKHLDTYFEFPPIYKPAKTRWNDDWTDENYPTPEPLLKDPVESKFQTYVDEAELYTWIAYAKLK